MWGRGIGRGRRWVSQAPSEPVKIGESGKVAVATASGGLDDVVSQMFARSPTFTLVEIRKGKIVDVKVISNKYVNNPSGVAIAVSQMLANLGVNVVIAGNFGPNAYRVLSQLGIKALTVPPGTKVREAVNSVIS